MSGGWGKVHSGHASSLGIMSVQRHKSFKSEVDREIAAFGNLSKNEAIQKCTTECQMFVKARCTALGCKAPVGESCKPQLISRRER